MTARGTYFRPELEMLERRELPSTMGLSHRPIPINTTVTGTIAGVVSLDLRIHRLRLGPVHGPAVLTAIGTGAGGDHAGTLVFRADPDVGTIRFSDTGNMNLQAMTFTESVAVERGTGDFHGARGQLAINGSFDAMGHFSATVVGEVAL
jgi:hypothetical protein